MYEVQSNLVGQKRVPSPGALAVVLIHGIGDITPGDVLNSSVTALEKHFGVKAVTPSQVASRAQSFGVPGRATVRKAEVRWSGRQIDLVEFNWTSLIGKIRLGHPIDAIRKFLGVLRDVPALGSIGAADSLDRALLSVCAWLYQTIFLVLLLTVVATVGHELMRIEAYVETFSDLKIPQTVILSEQAMAQSSKEVDKVLSLFSPQDSTFFAVIEKIGWAVLFAFIVPLFVLPVYVIIRILNSRHVRRATIMLLAAGVGWVLVLLATVSLMMAGSFALGIGLSFGESQTDLWATLVGVTLLALLSYWVPAKVIVVLGNLMRDVVHYLAPDVKGALTPDQFAIRTELWQLISGLQAEGQYERIVLVAHSLGTVILTDLLLERAPSTVEVQPSPLDVVTAGSPLRRLRLFFPDRTPDLLSLRRQLAEGPGVRVVRWFNAYRLADYVGQALTRSAFLLDLIGSRWATGDLQTGIRDHLLTPRYHWPFAHANYWGDSRFLRFVALDVIQPLLDNSEESSASTNTLPVL